MNGADPFVVDINALAGGMVSGDVGDVERSLTDPRALSCQLVAEGVTHCHKVATAGPGKRPSYAC